ncbi:MAG: hypothetical protein ACEPOV_08370 [Hyphomicrobiales bacterium]
MKHFFTIALFLMLGSFVSAQVVDCDELLRSEIIYSGNRDAFQDVFVPEMEDALDCAFDDGDAGAIFFRLSMAEEITDLTLDILEATDEIITYADLIELLDLEDLFSTPEYVEGLIHAAILEEMLDDEFNADTFDIFEEHFIGMGMSESEIDALAAAVLLIDDDSLTFAEFLDAMYE